MSILDTRNSDASAGVFVWSNEQGTNRVLAFRRGEDGALESAGDYPTGGAGLGAVHLGSQGSVVLTADGRYLLVTNAGSDDVAVFAVHHTGFELIQTTPSDGDTPVSVTEHDGLVHAVEAHPGQRDEDLSSDGRYLYAIDADAHRVFGWQVGADGRLTSVGSSNGLPDSVAGLAAC